MNRNNKYEKLLWSIALPGFGQILNGKFLKGLLIIALEFLVNVQSNFNEVILLSFHGEIEKAIQQANYQWLMFYPCLYFFAMWDAYKDAGGGKSPFAFLPFAFSAYLVTVGLIFSPTFKIMGILFGPVWLPIMCVVPGVVIGLIIKELSSR
ncbi:hypothetical protein MUO14_17175 [Halobacillus shinanisalinarum]|uniref:Uncharacterized protein n=1 Tax=Halobacillus shinanisalinarum TaxID=2932258 RepID=A0ABY4H5I6_9BACI|nr:hypothetical protein [Halobacillus shinanisalinarum]UOQ95726.1 hypothetical protein MUO14_17175 [Halobacillus shinanisalinarum]